MPQGGHNPPGRAWGPRHAHVGCSHLGGLPHRLFPYKFTNIPETLGGARKHNSNHHKFQNHEIQSNSIMEGFIILIGASPMMRE